MGQWEVERAAGRCTVTGKVFTDGEEFYTVLIEEGDLLSRADYSVDAWSGPPEGCFCHFKSRVPVKEKRRKLLVDNEVLINFFLRLAEETEPVRVQFRFVLALILMRKRLLKYEQSTREDDIETWKMTLTRDHSTHTVINPHLTDEQIEGVSRQVTAVLHGDMGDWTDEEENAVDGEPANDENRDENQHEPG